MPPWPRCSTGRLTCAEPTRSWSGTQGYDPLLHELLTAELGLLGLVVPEHLGGLGLGVPAATAVIEELGARLVPGALATSLTAILAARALGPTPSPCWHASWTSS